MNFYMFSNTLLNNFFVLRSLKDTSNCGDKANDSDLHLQEITHTYNLNILYLYQYLEIFQISKSNLIKF